MDKKLRTHFMLSNEDSAFVDEIVKDGAHSNTILNDKRSLAIIKGLIAEICFDIGINTHCGYAGTKRNEDCILYLVGIQEEIQRLQRECNGKHIDG